MAAALTGTFGFELDLTRYSEQELTALRSWVTFYQEHGALLRSGELYRLCSAGQTGAAWAIAAQDQSEAVIFAVGSVLDGRCLALPFADRTARYRIQAWYSTNNPEATGCTQNEYDGDTLHVHGLPLVCAGGNLPGYVGWLKKTSA